jgi:hypothetical protein
MLYEARNCSQEKTVGSLELKNALRFRNWAESLFVVDARISLLDPPYLLPGNTLKTG